MDVAEDGIEPGSRVDPDSVLVQVFQSEPKSADAEQKEGPVYDALVVGEIGAP